MPVSTEDRRQQVISAAVEVITREGAARATTRRVAAEAGAPLASLHYAFRNKEELFRSVIERCLDIVDEKFAANLDPSIGMRGAVRTLIALNLSWSRDRPQFHIAEYELLLWALRTPSARGFSRYMYERWFARIDAILAGVKKSKAIGDKERALIARQVTLVVDGMVLQVLALGDRGPQEGDIDRLTSAAIASFEDYL